MYEFYEPHITGGSARIRISEKQVITYMRIVALNTERYRTANDDDLVTEFCLINGADEIVEHSSAF